MGRHSGSVASLATRAAETAVTAAAPELALPAKAAVGIARAARQALGKGREAQGDHPSPESPNTAVSERPFIELKPMRVRKRRGVVVVEPAKGLSAGEALAAAAIAGLAYGSYVVYQDIHGWKGWGAVGSASKLTFFGVPL